MFERGLVDWCVAGSRVYAYGACVLDSPYCRRRRRVRWNCPTFESDTVETYRRSQRTNWQIDTVVGRRELVRVRYPPRAGSARAQVILQSRVVVESPKSRDSRPAKAPRLALTSDDDDIPRRSFCKCQVAARVPTVVGRAHRRRDPPEPEQSSKIHISSLDQTLFERERERERERRSLSLSLERERRASNV